MEEEKTFSIEAVQGNKGLCGNVTGLQPCMARRQVSKKGHKIFFLIIFPLLGTLSLVMMLEFSSFIKEKGSTPVKIKQITCMMKRCFQ